MYLAVDIVNFARKIVELVLMKKIVKTRLHFLAVKNFDFTRKTVNIFMRKLTSLAARFTTGTTGLKSQFFAPGLQGGKAFLGPSGQVNVNGSPHAGAQVGGAGVQVAQLFVQHEFLAGFGFDGVTNSLDTTSQPFENTSDITT